MYYNYVCKEHSLNFCTRVITNILQAGCCYSPYKKEYLNNQVLGCDDLMHCDNYD